MTSWEKGSERIIMAYAYCTILVAVMALLCGGCGTGRVVFHFEIKQVPASATTTTTEAQK